MARERAPHRWNDGFTWALPDRAPMTITDEQRRQFDRDGFFVLRGAFTPDELAHVLEKFSADLLFRRAAGALVAAGVSPARRPTVSSLDALPAAWRRVAASG